MAKRPPAWRRYLRFWGTNIERDVDDELAFHLEMRVKEYVERGMTPADARARAIDRFGNSRRAHEECVVIDRTFTRQQRRATLVADLRHDATFAARLLGRQRLPSIVAILCLALGIGATTTMFSVGNTLLLRPLPYPNSPRVVSVGTIYTDKPADMLPSSFPDFVDWRAQSHSFDEMGASRPQSFSLFLGSPVRIDGASVTAGFFSVLGARAESGRLFTPDDDRPGAAKVVVVTHGLADARLGGAASVVGKTFLFDGVQKTVIGVLPDRVAYPTYAQVWEPLARDYFQSGRSSRGLEVIGALRTTTTIADAQRDMNAITTSLEQQHPGDDSRIATRLAPLRDRFVGTARDGLTALAIATLLVLIVACTNVAALQIARATARGREIAVRVAIGATRHRLLRQLLTENVIIAVTGGGLGVFIALFGTRYVARAIATSAPRWMNFAIDWRALVFSLVVSMLVGLAFGILPALRLIRVDPSAVLRGGGRATDSRGLTQRLFVIGEIALSLVLVIGAALAIASVVQLRRVPLGLDPSGVLSFRVGLAGERYESPRERGRMIAELADAVATLPGVVGAAATTYAPINGCCSQFGVTFEGRDNDPRHLLMVTGNMVTPGFFQTLRIPLLSGRDFTPADDSGAPRVVIINETFARRFWPEGDAVGHRIDTGGGMATIIGIVGDIKQGRIIDAPEPQFYRAHQQDPWSAMTYTVRVATGDPQRIVPDVRRILARLDPTLPIYAVTTLEQTVSSVVDSHRLLGILFAAFAGVALLLATAGIYATMSFFVARRTRELGLRIALGADPRRVVGLVLGQSALMAAAGALLGIIAGIVAARALAHILYGVTANDPLIYIIAAAALGVAALAATYGPARRASAIAPMIALRTD